MKHASPVSVFILALSLGSCKTGTESSPSPQSPAIISGKIRLTDSQIRNAGIGTGRFSLTRINDTLELHGVVDVPPQNIVSVSFPLGGYLKKTHLLPGMHVRRGQAIAVVEDAALVQLQQDYLIARTRLEQLRLDYERQRSLNESKTAADKVLQQARADYQSMQVQTSALAEKLRLVHLDPARLAAGSLSRQVAIPAPINGFVSRVNVNIGRYVQPQEVLFELINPSDIHAALTVFEKDINRLRIGQRVLVRFVDEPQTAYGAEVLLITRNVDENRSGIVHCHFERMPPDLKPGMFLTATVLLAETEVQALPEEAVVRYGSQEYVFVEQKRGHFLPVPVESGKRRGNLVEVRSPDARLFRKKVVTQQAWAVLSAWKNSGEEE